MKSTLFTTLCTLALVVWQSPLAVALDAIDDLLAGPSAAAEVDLFSQAPASDAGSADASTGDAASGDTAPFDAATFGAGAFDAAAFDAAVFPPAASHSSETHPQTSARSTPWASSVTGTVGGAHVGGRDEIPAHAQDHKSGPFNAVPEPTAMVMAVLALIYFLVFGRRRRVI